MSRGKTASHFSGSCFRRSGIGSKPSEIVRERSQVVGRRRNHEIAHTGIVAADAAAEIRHRLGEVIAALAGKARHRAVALKLLPMAAGAANRTVGGLGALCDILCGARLTKIGPWLVREVFGDRQHVVPFEGRGDRLHDLTLAIAALEITKLDVKVTGLLPPDVRNGLVDRLAVHAVTTGADLDFLV